MNGRVLALRRNILVRMVHTEGNALRVFRSDLCAGDATAADLDILVGRDILCPSPQCRVAHIGVQGFNGLFTSDRAHLGDVPGSHGTDDIIGETAALAYRGRINVAADTASSTTHKTAET